MNKKLIFITIFTIINFIAFEPFLFILQLKGLFCETRFIDTQLCFSFLHQIRILLKSNRLLMKDNYMNHLFDYFIKL